MEQVFSSVKVATAGERVLATGHATKRESLSPRGSTLLTFRIDLYSIAR